MTTKLELRMMATETDMAYLTSHFARAHGKIVHHNMLKDLSTACGLQLIGVRHLEPVGEPRCGNCARAVRPLL